MESRSSRAKLPGFLLARELDATSRRVEPSDLQLRSRQFDARIVAYHSRVHHKRITALEWSPDGRFVITGDKSGCLSVLDASRWTLGATSTTVPSLRHSRPVVAHRCNVTGVQFDVAHDGRVYTGSADGTVRCARFDTSWSPASSREFADDDDLVLDMNPGGWNGASKFKMVYGLDFDRKRSCLYVGASEGSMVRMDVREKRTNVEDKFHKDKITCVHVNPSNNDLLVTASNDRKVSLWDARKLCAMDALSSYTHGRAVSSAYFSPNTGSKLLTTSQDNKIRIWNDVHAFGAGSDVESAPHLKPLEIVHSHDFNRYLNAFRASWDSKDWRDDLFMCGRYLGDPYKHDGKEIMLHPIDMFSAKTGLLVHSLIDAKVTLICTTNRFCPTEDVVATAASGDVMLWGTGREGKRSRDDDKDDDASAKERVTIVVNTRQKRKRT